MKPSRILTFLTDFGGVDAYVAAMKGVALGRDPGLTLVDISHEVPPQDVARGAYLLAEAVPWFPAGTAHVAVVDPGVGTARRAIVAVLDEQVVVAPDNGLISRLYLAASERVVYEIVRADLGLPHRSMTFHGRDLFAPVGAMLASGALLPADCGPPIEPVLARERAPVREGDRLRGEVITADRFGNLITNIAGSALGPAPAVSVAGRPVDAFIRTYGERPRGSLVALVGSGGLLEIAVVEGNAAQALRLGPGALVEVRSGEAP